MIAILANDPAVGRIASLAAEAGRSTVLSLRDLASARELLQTLRLEVRVILADVAALEPDVERSLRTLEELDLPLLIVSAAPRQDLTRRGIYLGERSFAAVPCTAPQLAERIEHAERQHALLEEQRRRRRAASRGL